MRRSFLFFLIFLICSSFVLASSSMGVVPAKNTIIYQGAQTYERHIDILSGEEKNIRLKVAGPLADYITFENGEKTLEDHIVKGGRYVYRLDLPADMKPGNYETLVIASQYLTPEEILQYGNLNVAFAAVGHVVDVRVPNDGKFVEFSMQHRPSRLTPGETVFFELSLLNFGTETLYDIESEVIIEDPEGNPLDKRETNSLDILEPAETGKLLAFWDTKDRPAGLYKAYTLLDYGGREPAEASTSFRLGEIEIDILDIRSQLNLSIAKVFIDIASKWNDEITEVFAEIDIKDGDNLIDTIRTSSITLNPWGQATLTAFWEKAVLPPGEYTLEVKVFYYDTFTGSQTQVLLEEESEVEKAVLGASNLLVIVIILLSVIVAINLIWFVAHLRKKSKKKK